MELSQVLLHPVRMRIVRSFLGERHLRTADLAASLPRIPPASLYRHLRLLVDHGVLEIVEERPVRGATERTYALAKGDIGADDAGSISAEDLRIGFLTFVAGLVDDLEAYLDRGAVDPVRDQIGFREVGLHLSPAEADSLGAEMTQVLLRYATNAPSPERTLRVLASVLLPRSRTA